jgi:hypothetical protein
MIGIRLKPYLSWWQRRWQTLTSTKILKSGYLGGKYPRKYVIIQNTAVCSYKRSLKDEDNDHSYLENFTRNLIHKWHMSGRWCTPNLQLATMTFNLCPTVAPSLVSQRGRTHCQVYIARGWQVTTCLMSASVADRFPGTYFLKGPKRWKLLGARSGRYVGWSMHSSSPHSSLRNQLQVQLALWGPGSSNSCTL